MTCCSAKEHKVGRSEEGAFSILNPFNAQVQPETYIEENVTNFH